MLWGKNGFPSCIGSRGLASGVSFGGIGLCLGVCGLNVG